MKSPISGKEMVLKKESICLKFRKENFSIYNHFYFCEDSGEQFTSTDLDELNLLQLHNQYRDKHNLPFPNEIKEIRAKYEISAIKMSEILGFGANSYRNYENGEVPSSSNGRLIHMVNDPSKFRAMVDLCDTLPSGEKSKLIGTLEKLIHESNNNMFSSSMEDYLLGSRLPDSLSGYVKPDLAKLTEMVKFFAERLSPWKTVLNKLLFYSDFIAYRTNCYSMSGVRYRAIKMGPVPNNYNSIYDFMSNRNKVEIINIPFSESVFGDRFEKANNEKFNPEIFTKNELDILEKVGKNFSGMKTKQVIDFSHNEKAWIENESERKLISYNYAFDIEQI